VAAGLTRENGSRGRGAECRLDSGRRGEGELQDHCQEPDGDAPFVIPLLRRGAILGRLLNPVRETGEEERCPEEEPEGGPEKDHLIEPPCSS
jgi:hypothetical protein